jgi:hypothetical protein
MSHTSLQGPSSDISLTCSVLNELSKALEQDGQAKVCSSEAFTTAQDVSYECDSVFSQIESAIEKHNQEINTVDLTWSTESHEKPRKATAGLFGPNLEVLKCNL